ncbi:hypothetical protein LIA77_05744 [Sarocladium implicatum]|nr:hypothetical protein LIA77_05744 [Sarocladium implicatum]
MEADRQLNQISCICDRSHVALSQTWNRPNGRKDMVTDRQCSAQRAKGADSCCSCRLDQIVSSTQCCRRSTHDFDRLQHLHTFTSSLYVPLASSFATSPDSLERARLFLVDFWSPNKRSTTSSRCKSLRASS